VVEVDALPRSAVLAAQPEAMQRECLLAGGDDYELLFTALPTHRDAVAGAGAAVGVAVTRIGRIEAGDALRLVDRGGAEVESAFASFDHFRT
jgi:thiamine-monophosphate kinase